jgi:protocatechuate 3,4-dioxygenase beta subunit
LLGILALVLGLRDTPGRALPSPPKPLAANAAAQSKLCVTVVEKGGAPVPSARVFVYRELPDRRFALAGDLTSNAEGAGCLAQVEHGKLWVLAHAAGRARASTQLVLEAERTLRIELGVAAHLQVKVQDELGAPLAKATVLVTASDPLPYGALTDEQGATLFEKLPGAPWSVRAAAPGYESVLRSGVASDLTLALRRLSSLDVRVVTNDGAPAANAQVLIAGSSLWPARRAETDAAGLARIRGLSAGSYDLSARRGGDVAETVLGYALARGAQETLTLRLEPGRMVTALVTDGEGESPQVVANADVVLVEGGVGSFPLRGRTGSDGKVVLGPIARGAATLGARARDFVGGPLVSVPEPLTGPVRVPLVRGGVLRGEVVDARGAPIGGASIEVVGSDRFGLPIAETPLASNFRASHFEWTLTAPPGLIPAGELGVMPGPVPPIPPPGSVISSSSGLAPVDPEPASFDIPPWVTSALGEFEARPVTPGRVRALVRHPEYVEGASELVSITPGGEARVRVVLLKGGSLEGRVVDERGFPVPSVEVQIVAERGTFERSTVTASDGAFAFAAVPENITLSVLRFEDRARVALRKQLKVAEGARERIELVLPTPRESVRIVVLDERDTPVELAEVRATSLDANAPLRATLFTDALGAVTLSDALGLSLRLVIEAPRFATLTRTLDKAPAELRLSLDPGVLVSGRVTAVRGRRAAAGALVTLRFGATRKTTMTDADGNYRFPSVPTGPIDLAVTHPDYASGSGHAEVARTGRNDRPFEIDPIDLSEPGEIEGQVLDAEGRPVEGARVAVGLAPAYLPAGALPAGLALSDSRGHFTLRGVAEGTLKIGAHATGVGRGAADAVSVQAGRTTRGVTIRLSERVSEDDPLAAAGVAITLAERGSAGDLKVTVAQVASGSEAERGGLVAGDELERIDGEAPKSMADARARLSGREGSDVAFDVLRGGARVRLSVRREAVRR